MTRLHWGHAALRAQVLLQCVCMEQVASWKWRKGKGGRGSDVMGGLVGVLVY